jgi:hypothetical protein
MISFWISVVPPKIVVITSDPRRLSHQHLSVAHSQRLSAGQSIARSLAAARPARIRT